MPLIAWIRWSKDLAKGWRVLRLWRFSLGARLDEQCAYIAPQVYAYFARMFLGYVYSHIASPLYSLFVFHPGLIFATWLKYTEANTVGYGVGAASSVLPRQWEVYSFIMFFIGQSGLKMSFHLSYNTLSYSMSIITSENANSEDIRYMALFRLLPTLQL